MYPSERNFAENCLKGEVQIVSKERGEGRGEVWSKWPKHLVEIGKVQGISLERLKGVFTNLLFILNCIL